jgi:hypothetical protein
MVFHLLSYDLMKQKKGKEAQAELTSSDYGKVVMRFVIRATALLRRTP